MNQEQAAAEFMNHLQPIADALNEAVKKVLDAAPEGTYTELDIYSALLTFIISIEAGTTPDEIRPQALSESNGLSLHVFDAAREYIDKNKIMGTSAVVGLVRMPLIFFKMLQQQESEQQILN